MLLSESMSALRYLFASARRVTTEEALSDGHNSWDWEERKERASAKVGVNELHAGEAKIAAAGGGQGVHNVAEGVVVAEELHLHRKKALRT
jgi:hypothetical protein